MKFLKIIHSFERVADGCDKEKNAYVEQSYAKKVQGKYAELIYAYPFFCSLLENTLP